MKEKKLKTLKDLDLAWNEKKTKEILKAEAVKWVKSYGSSESWRFDLLKVNEWIIHFFNLREEVLK